MTTQSVLAVFGVPIIGLLATVVWWGIKNAISNGRRQREEQDILNDAAQKKVIQARIRHDKIMSEIVAGVDDARASELLSKPPVLSEYSSAKATTVKKSIRAKMRGIRGK